MDLQLGTVTAAVWPTHSCHPNKRYSENIAQTCIIGLLVAGNVLLGDHLMLHHGPGIVLAWDTIQFTYKANKKKKKIILFNLQPSICSDFVHPHPVRYGYPPIQGCGEVGIRIEPH
jgi:hypothetical protein